MKKEKALDLPWGIMSGVSAMIVFFGVIAFILIYVISSGIAQQTSETVSAFETWYQTLIFVVVIIAAVAAVASLVMYVIRERTYKSAAGSADGETAKEERGA